MDSILPPPPPFSFVNSLENVTTGNLSKEWEKWKNAFLIYYDACELSKKDSKVQLSILLHIVGEQCREVYEQFDKSSITKSSELLDKFDSFFLPKKNLTIERHRFFTRDQKEGESIEQYSFELKKLASSCEFKDLMETLIRDRLICGIKDHAIRERLLREPDLTLKKSLDICNVAQISKVQAGAIKKESVEHHAYAVQRDYFGHHGVLREDSSEISDVNRVMWVSRRGAPAHRGAARGWPRGRRQPSRPRAPPAHPPAPPVQRWNLPMQRNQLTYEHGRSSERSAWCSMCGYEHGNSRCPAAGKRCLNCNRFDHFSRMCKIYEIQADDSTDQILLLAAIAMASAQAVNVVDSVNNPGPGQVNVVEQPGDAVKTVGQTSQVVDSGFYLPSSGDNVVIANPDPAYYVGSANTGAVQNPDPGFYLPGNDAVQTPSIDSAIVDPAFYRPSINLRPLKYPNPAARTGK
ncbi:uncharacterized protein LOC134749544 isoform X2 [Cydia strobilella]|uniref:uncharacterized protein LOC134749544 isoform X2 n=1 Tax=Cydia strobilella TaxID=1100964 RepID=UPI0030047801